MKTLSPAFQAHLDSGATTLCHCWRLKRADGVVAGFTEHDRDLTFDNLLYEAAAGITASAVGSSNGLAVDNLDVVGALDSSHLTDADLAAGLYDNADIEIWRVNWQDTQQRVLLRKGNLGEVQRSAQGFSAEVRGLSHRLNQSTGRLFQYACDANVADIRCGVELTPGIFVASGLIDAVRENRILTVSGLVGFDDGWFSRGLWTFTSGANESEVLEVKSHTRRGDSVVIELWHEPAQSIEPGEEFSIKAGCDKQLGTCRDKFSNSDHFRGFPHMPGNDFALSYARRGGPNDGGRLI